MDDHGFPSQTLHHCLTSMVSGTNDQPQCANAGDRQRHQQKHAYQFREIARGSRRRDLDESVTGSQVGLVSGGSQSLGSKCRTLPTRIQSGQVTFFHVLETVSTVGNGCISTPQIAPSLSSVRHCILCTIGLIARLRFPLRPRR